MKHLYEKGLFAAAYAGVALWGAYEMTLPVNQTAVSEEITGHLLILGALYGFFRLMLAHSLCWNAYTWSVILVDMGFGLRFWYDASALGMHHHILLWPEPFFYGSLALYMILRAVLLYEQRKRTDVKWQYPTAGYRRIAGISAACGVLVLFLHHPAVIVLCLLAGSAAAFAGWTEELEENHRFSY